ncbi:DUF1273 domain-containing protein [Fictibacillus iocasae]|uniref:UPF0398 protein ACFQPF_02665 n=1 Tax=Fictibacillus iocasae TaxID=2715437 RepID=A0ABW2NMD1_9BACL
MQTLLVTGYKSHELGIFKENHEGVYYIKKALLSKLSAFVEEGLEWVIISGQTGVEMWAAEVVISLKERLPELKLAVITPFLEQEKNWNETKQEQYEEILMQADYVDSVTKRPYENPGQLKVKNAFLVAKTEGMLILFDEEKEGSPKYYLQAARQKQERGETYEIHFITPYDLELIYQDEQESKYEE